MGQYCYVVNLSKKEYLSPSSFDEGLKLIEFGCGRFGTLFGLSVLLACSNGKGSGDFHGEDPLKLVGSWAGDEIAIVGDYYELGDLSGDKERLPLDWMSTYKDISTNVVELTDHYRQLINRY